VGEEALFLLGRTRQVDAGGIGYGWLGGKERATDTTGPILMGARVYNSSSGTFSSTDPVFGGNTTSYAYPQDPVNKVDLDGRSQLQDPSTGGGGTSKAEMRARAKEERALQRKMRKADAMYERYAKKTGKYRNRLSFETKPKRDGTWTEEHIDIHATRRATLGHGTIKGPHRSTDIRRNHPKAPEGVSGKIGEPVRVSYAGMWKAEIRYNWAVWRGRGL
jgi:RHS repeat-associated protein